MRTALVALLGVTAAALAVPIHLAGQSPAVSAVASTFGFGGEVSFRLSRSFGVRGGYYMFSMDRSSDIEEVRYDLSPRFRNGAVALDVHPFGGAFRLSAGAVVSGSRADGRAVLNQPVEIGGRTYQPEDVGELLARAKYDRGVMPFLGLGVAGNGRVSPTFDVGVAFSGYPDVRLTVNSPLTGAERAELDASVAQEEAQIRASIRERSWTRYYPVVALGIKLRM